MQGFHIICKLKSNQVEFGKYDNRLNLLIGRFCKTTQRKKIFNQDNFPIDDLKEFQKELKAIIKTQITKQNEGIINNEQIILEEIIKSIQVEQSGNVLTLKTITQILERSLDLAKSDYVKITVENRRLRREFRKTDGKKYQQLVLEYNEHIESILEQKRDVICRALDISVEQFQESVNAILERGFFQQFFMTQASIRQKIKESIPKTKNINVEQLKQIVEYQLQVVKKKPRDLQDIINQFTTDQETASLIPLAVNTVLADFVLEKFQIEEEDMIRMMQNPENFADQEMQGLMMQLEQAMYELMGPMAGM